MIAPRCAIYFAMCAATLALVAGLAIPRWIPLQFVQENGPVELGTLCMYLLATAGALLMQWRTALFRDVVAVCALLLAAAAREADLHIALYGVSILKSRFYADAPPHQILGALAILAPVLASGIWLTRRFAHHWLRHPARWTAPATTVAVMLCSMLVAKILDRTPDWLGHARERLPDAALYVILSIEEVLELALPLFALLATAQGRWPERNEG